MSPRRSDSPEASADSFDIAKKDLRKAYKRVVPNVPLPGKEELKQKYPNLLSDISKIVEGGGPKKASMDA